MTYYFIINIINFLHRIVFVSGRDNLVLEVLSALMALRLLRILAYFKSNNTVRTSEQRTPWDQYQLCCFVLCSSRVQNVHVLNCIEECPLLYCVPISECPLSEVLLYILSRVHNNSCYYIYLSSE